MDWPFSSPADLLDSGIKPASLLWQVDSLPLNHLGSPIKNGSTLIKKMSSYVSVLFQSFCRGTQGPDPQPSPGSPHLFSEPHCAWHMSSQGRGPPAMEIQNQLSSANIWGQAGVGAKSCRTSQVSQTKDVTATLSLEEAERKDTAGLWLEIQSMREEPTLRAMTALKKWAQNLRPSAREGWGEQTESLGWMYTHRYI